MPLVLGGLAFWMVGVASLAVSIRAFRSYERRGTERRIVIGVAGFMLLIGLVGTFSWSGGPYFSFPAACLIASIMLRGTLHQWRANDARVRSVLLALDENPRLADAFDRSRILGPMVRYIRRKHQE